MSVSTMGSTDTGEQSERIVGIQGAQFYALRSDGTVRRLIGTELVDPNPENFKDGVKSKDITISPETGVLARMFLPQNENNHQPCSKLPILFYVHGGGFCIESAVSVMYHAYLSKVAREIGMLCVSVNYRLAPEHRLPAAYDDCFEALRWLLAGPGKNDPWVATHGDLGRILISGDSAGGNIIHEIGLRAGRAEWDAEVKFEGAFVVQPFFQEKIDAQTDEKQVAVLKERDAFMKEVCLPFGEILDEYPPFNPVGPRSPPLREMVFRRMMVAVAEKDTLKGAGLSYFEALKGEGMDVALVVTAGEGHVFHLFDMEGASASAFMDSFRQFVWVS